MEVSYSGCSFSEGEKEKRCHFIYLIDKVYELQTFLSSINYLLYHFISWVFYDFILVGSDIDLSYSLNLVSTGLLHEILVKLIWVLLSTVVDFSLVFYSAGSRSDHSYLTKRWWRFVKRRPESRYKISLIILLLKAFVKFNFSLVFLYIEN